MALAAMKSAPAPHAELPAIDPERTWSWALAAVPPELEISFGQVHDQMQTPAGCLRVLRALDVPHAYTQQELEHKTQLIAPERRLQVLRGLLWTLLLQQFRMPEQLDKGHPLSELLVLPGLPHLQLLDALVRCEVQSLQDALALEDRKGHEGGGGGWKNPRLELGEQPVPDQQESALYTHLVRAELQLRKAPYRQVTVELQISTSYPLRLPMVRLVRPIPVHLYVDEMGFLAPEVYTPENLQWSPETGTLERMLVRVRELLDELEHPSVKAEAPDWRSPAFHSFVHSMTHRSHAEEDACGFAPGLCTQKFGSPEEFPERLTQLWQEWPEHWPSVQREGLERGTQHERLRAQVIEQYRPQRRHPSLFLEDIRGTGGEAVSETPLPTSAEVPLEAWFAPEFLELTAICRSWVQAQRALHPSLLRMHRQSMFQPMIPERSVSRTQRNSEAEAEHKQEDVAEPASSPRATLHGLNQKQLQQVDRLEFVDLLVETGLLRRDGSADEDYIFSFPMFTDSFCRMLKEECLAFDQLGLPKSRPNSMNRYGVILSELGLDRMCDEVMEILSPVSSCLFPKWGGATLDHHHCFIVSYRPNQDRSLDMHTDDSEVTVNVCLEDGFSGCQLDFCGRQGEETLRKHKLAYQHERGRGVIHLGIQRHGAAPILEGERHNLIMWFRSSLFRLNQQIMQEGRARHPQEEAPDPVCLSRTHDSDYRAWQR